MLIFLTITLQEATVTILYVHVDIAPCQGQGIPQGTRGVPIKKM